MSIVDPKDGQPHFCFEHGNAYGDDGLMCGWCENDIARQHDPLFKEKEMTEVFKPVDTTAIQEQSLVDFMAAIGYEPTYKMVTLGSVTAEQLNGFYQPKFKKTGKARLSVNTAIRMHNELAEDTFAKLVSFTPYEEFIDFVAKQDNVDELIAVFAGTCKIVNFISATYSKKKGFVVHNHNVKFMSKRDQRFYGF